MKTRNILLFEDFVGGDYSRYGRVSYQATEDPDKLTTGIMGAGHVIIADDMQFDPYKVRTLIGKDEHMARVAMQVMSANAPDFEGSLGQEQIDGLRMIFDEVVMKNYRLRQAYKSLPDETNETIRRKGREWCVVSRTGNKNLGCSRTKKGAEKRLRQVEYFKNR